MNYTTHNSWMKHTAPEEKSVSDEERHVPSQEAIRRMMLAEGSEPAFFCPACKGRFKIEYGRYGHLPVSFSENSNWCLDCAKLNQIVRVR